jgi:hypothetical protein
VYGVAKMTYRLYIQIDSVRQERGVDSKNLTRAAKLYFEGT